MDHCALVSKTTLAFVTATALSGCFGTSPLIDLEDLDPIDREFLETISIGIPPDENITEGDPETVEDSEIAEDEGNEAETITPPEDGEDTSADSENSAEPEEEAQTEAANEEAVEPEDIAPETETVTSDRAAALPEADTAEEAEDSTLPLTPASSADLSLARRAVSLCTQTFPDNEATFQALRDRGFATAGQDSRFSILENANRTVAVTISRGEPIDKICAITVANLTDAQAIELIQPWVQAIRGRPDDVDSEEVAAAWRGRFGNDLAYATVISSSIYRPIDGAWIRLLVVDR